MTKSKLKIYIYDSRNKEKLVSALPQKREAGNDRLIYGNYTLSK